MSEQKVQSVDAYIQSFPLQVRERLIKMREIILLTVPDVEEGFAYGMPAYKLMGKPLVYFAAFEKHIGFYATPSGHSEFKQRLAAYRGGKGSVQFPLSEPLPLSLIRDMVSFRAIENRRGASGINS